MKDFRLVFESRAKSPYARVVIFHVPILADNLKDATLIGERMQGEPTWLFLHAEEGK